VKSMFKSDRKVTPLVRYGRIWIAVVALAVAGCADHENMNAKPRLPAPTKVVKEARQGEVTLMSGTETQRSTLSATEGVSPPVGRTLAEPFSSSAAPKLSGEKISVDFEGIKLPAFINTVFGDLLKLSFEIDSAVTKRDQLVTLRTTEPISPDEFYQVIVELLSNYGIGVVYQGNVNIYRVIEASTAKQDVPRIIRSRALGSVPGDQRPIFFFTPIHNVQSGFMQSSLELALRDRVRFSGVGTSNGLLLMGKREDINAALETIEILDQPYMAGNHSMKISPAFWSAAKLAEQLISVLTAEGYSAGLGAQAVVAIRMIPIDALNIIIVFSTNSTTLQHVLRWATDLDQPSQTVNTQGIFYYQVQNASAKKVADLVGQILGDEPGGGGNGGGGGGNSNQAQRTAGQQTTGLINTNRRRVTVDESRNAIIFQGTADEYAQFRNLVQQMDRAPLEVMIEATVAEVTLDQSENLGIILGFDDGATLAPNRNTVRSDTGLFATLLRSRGQISASLNALASNSRVTVLSTPRLVTTSGQVATMQVGSQVPIITTQQTAPTGIVGGTSNILQDVQYRSTGILLNIKPTINSDRVELTIQQEVSSASANNISKVDSPIIQQRSINTTLSLSDGQTALLGGLITDNYNSGNSGVPYLKDIPLIGNLFKNQSKSHTRTELIILLTPYIVDGAEASRAVRDAFQDRLGDWARNTPLDVVDKIEARPSEVQ
jgi:general secretion pathway protein D